MDENKEVNSTDPKREKVRVIPLSAIDDAPDHPFGVRDDEEMAELVESIKVISADIRKLQREQDLCQDITFRSAGIEEVVRLIEEPERQKELQRKENEKYESKR